VDQDRYLEAVALLDSIGDSALVDDASVVACVRALLGSIGITPHVLLTPPDWFTPEIREPTKTMFARLLLVDEGKRRVLRRAGLLARRVGLGPNSHLALSTSRFWGAMAAALDDYLAASRRSDHPAPEQSSAKELLDELRVLSSVAFTWQYPAAINTSAVAAEILAEINESPAEREVTVFRCIDAVVLDDAARRRGR
jgi:hypothetical protein